MLLLLLQRSIRRKWRALLVVVCSLKSAPTGNRGFRRWQIKPWADTLNRFLGSLGCHFISGVYFLAAWGAPDVRAVLLSRAVARVVRFVHQCPVVCVALGANDQQRRPFLQHFPPAASSGAEEDEADSLVPLIESSCLQCVGMCPTSTPSGSHWSPLGLSLCWMNLKPAFTGHSVSCYSPSSGFKH